MLNIYVIPPALSVVIGLALALISAFKGKFKVQNILFSMVILWWSLISAAFVLHHFHQGDSASLLRIERIIHLLYVYVPVVNLVFFHRIFNVNRNSIIIVSVVLSTILCILVPTKYYFSGLHTYSWGVIAAGGIASRFVGIYGLSFIVYLIMLLVSKLRSEDNQILRLKIKYILISIIVIALMQVMNLPAMYGVDCYPVGNFIFIPLAIMAYGILQHRLMDIQTILHMTFIWGVVSSLALLLNAVIYMLAKDFLTTISTVPSFAILLLWFMINYLYLRKVQPKIDQLFNKRKFDLKKTEIEIIENILQLRTLADLSKELTSNIKKTLYFKKAEFLINDPAVNAFRGLNQQQIPCQDALAEWLLNADLVQKDQVETDPQYATIRDPLLGLFRDLDCDHIVPLAQNNELLAILALNDRKNLKQLNADERNYLRNITAAVLISFANSIMYQDLKNLKDNLESMVQKRTMDLSRAMERMEAAHQEIKETKNELQNERDLLSNKNRLMEEELILARKIQEQFIPLTNPSATIHSVYKPMRQVGGDFFDFLKFRDCNKIGIFVSDVSGHGVPAAFITSMIKTLILQSGRIREDPAALMSYLNENLVQHTGGNFITAFYCIYDAVAREILFSNAGHNHPYAVYARHNSIVAGHRGLPLAIMDNNALLAAGKQYQNTKTVLKGNSRLVLYTDGLAECMNMANPGVMFEEKLVAENFYNSPKTGIKQFSESILRELVLFRGDDSFEDDICIICLDIS